MLALPVLLVLAISPAASARDSGELREFSGEVAAISADAMTITNRQGDRVSFRRSDATKVSGAKQRWQAIEPGDRVRVSWKIVDSPRIAYKVSVMPREPKSRE